MARLKVKRDAAGDRLGEPREPESDAAVNDPALHAETAPQLEPAANDPVDRNASSLEAREARIRERAYRRAEARGFAPGQELEDWLAAESEDPGDNGTGGPR